MSNFLMKMKFFKGKKSMNLCQNEIPPQLVFITKKNPESWEKFHSLSNEKLTTICKKRAILCWTGQKEKKKQMGNQLKFS